TVPRYWSSPRAVVAREQRGAQRLRLRSVPPSWRKYVRLATRLRLPFPPLSTSPALHRCRHCQTTGLLEPCPVLWLVIRCRKTVAIGQLATGVLWRSLRLASFPTDA